MTLRIVDHRLVGHWWKASPNQGGPLRAPSLLVIHFTASGGDGPEGDAHYLLRPEARASAHVIVGRDGRLMQIVPFDRQAWHAGRSTWRGVPNCNAYSIGVEVDNWGQLARTADGAIRSWTGTPVDPARAVELTHKHDTRPTLWETFPEAQVSAVADLVRALLAAYPSLREIVGHDDIAPGRKRDPGPAFPMGRLQALAEGRDDPPSLTRRVIAGRLNARTGPGLEHEVLGVFRGGAEVEVIYDAPGAWAQVRGRLATGELATAWVADQHLR